MSNRESSSSKILLKGLGVIELLADSPDGLPASKIADAIGLSRGAVYRYLSAFIEGGYVVKTANNRYRLGTRILELASLALARTELRNVAHDLLISLCEATGGTVHLCKLDAAEIIYLDKVEAHCTLPILSRIGGRAPAYCTAVGKLLLAQLHPEQIDRVLESTELVKLTQKTETDPDRLRMQLRDVKAQGFALDRGEHEEGVDCVAVPIYDLAGDVIAAVSVTDLRRRVEGNEKVYRREALAIAKEISARMGFHQKAPSQTHSTR